MQRAQVLIVAASRFQLTLMADLLEANDIEAVLESDLQKAGRFLTVGEPAMVVVDMDLAHGAPKGLDRLRQEAQKRHIPVLVVATAGQDAVARQILAGCHAGTVAKPIDTSAFPRTVVQEIRRRTTQQGRSAEA